MNSLVSFETYLYFWGSVVGLIIFGFIYWKNFALRHEMLISGIVVAIIGVLSERTFFSDYWNPPLILKFGNFGGIEDIMFGFAAGGIGAVIFNVIFSTRLIANRKPRHLIIPSVFISEYVSIFVLHGMLGINSIYASAVGFCIPAMGMLIVRRDLLWDAVYSAAVTGFILVVAEGVLLALTGGEYLERFYLLHGEAPVLFGIFPVTEFLWGLSFGALIGPVYEFATGRSIKRSRALNVAKV